MDEEQRRDRLRRALGIMETWENMPNNLTPTGRAAEQEYRQRVEAQWNVPMWRPPSPLNIAFDLAYHTEHPTSGQEEERNRAMKYYLFYDLTAEDVEYFSEEDVYISPFEGGYIIDGEDYDEVARREGAPNYVEVPTQFEGVVRMDLASEKAEGSLRTAENDSGLKVQANDTEGWHGRTRHREAFVKLTADILLPVVKKDIAISVPHGRARALPAEDGTFRIFIWSTPASDEGVEREYSPPERIWDIVTSCRDRGYDYSGRGINIVDEGRGYSVAELVGDNLYIHHDLVNTGYGHELALYQRLLNEVVEVMKVQALTPEERVEYQKQKSLKQLVETRALYIEKCTRRMRGTRDEIERVISRDRTTIADYQVALVNKIRSLQANERRLVQLLADDTEDTSKYGEEFDKLMAMEKVIGVTATDDRVDIFTDTLYCEHEGELYDIGAFRIQVNNTGVNMFNLTRQVRQGGEDSGGGRMQAPHVNYRGEACTGNTGEIWPQLVASYEYAAIAMVAIQFLESVNYDDSWGSQIKYWPKVDKEAIKKKETEAIATTSEEVSEEPTKEDTAEAV